MAIVDPFEAEVRELVSGLVKEQVQKNPGTWDGPIKVVLNWEGIDVELAETPNGSLRARREMIVSALTDLCMKAVKKHDCCERVVQAVHSL